MKWVDIERYRKNSNSKRVNRWKTIHNYNSQADFNMWLGEWVKALVLSGYPYKNPYNICVQLTSWWVGKVWRKAAINSSQKHLHYCMIEKIIKRYVERYFWCKLYMSPEIEKGCTLFSFTSWISTSKNRWFSTSEREVEKECINSQFQSLLVFSREKATKSQATFCGLSAAS